MDAKVSSIATVDSGAVNMDVQVTMWYVDLESFKYIPKGATSG